MKFLIFNVLFVFILVTATAQSADYPTNQEIAEVIKTEVENKRSSSIAIGIIDNGLVSYISYGQPIEGNPVSANEKTIYEIASITKVFTTTILADMILKKEINLNDLIIQYLPDSLQYKDKRIDSITIQHLVTHTSGLQIKLKKTISTASQPFKNITYNEMFASISKLGLTSNPGTQFEYQNLNISVLAYILCKKSNKNLEQLFNEKIFIPFGMTNTGFTLTDKQKNFFATAYYQPGAIAENLIWADDAAAGGLRSTTEDMLIFMRKLFFEKSGFSEAAKLAIQPLFAKTNRPGAQIGMGWYVNNVDGHIIVGHGGSLKTAKSQLIYDITSNRGCIVLSNSGNDISDIAQYTLNKNVKIKKYIEPEYPIIPDTLLQKMEGSYLVHFNNKTDTIFFYKKSNIYFVLSQDIGEIEVFYKNNNIIFLPALKANLEFADLRNNLFHSIVCKELPSFQCARIE